MSELDDIKTKSISGTYIVEGALSEAIYTAADDMLLKYYCNHASACGKCSGCNRFKNRKHIDLLLIDTDKGSIRIDTVREIPQFVYRKSFEGGLKTVLIPQAHKLTEQAQNALLKVLEEPAENTVFILGTPDSRYLLPTIRSRCVLRRPPKDEGKTATFLTQEFDLPKVKAQVLFRVAKGDYYLAKKYAEIDYFLLRQDMMLMLNRLFHARNMATNAMEKLLLKYEYKIEETLNIALLYIKDVLLLKHTNSKNTIANIDVLPEIQKHTKQSDFMLINTIEIISEFLKECAVCKGLNKKLVLTGVFFDLLEIRLFDLKTQKQVI